MTDRNDTRIATPPPAKLIREYLQIRPAASSADVVRWLRRCGVEITAEAAGAVLAAIKTG